MTVSPVQSSPVRSGHYIGYSLISSGYVFQTAIAIAVRSDQFMKVIAVYIVDVGIVQLYGF